MKIDHIAIAVNDVEESAKIYQQALWIDEIEFETVESEGVKVAIIPMENGRIELMQPTNDSSPIKKFLEKKGPGLHHMALDTDNIEGLAYVKEDLLGNVKTIVKKMPKMVDVNDLPMINWDKINPSLYKAHNWHCFGYD